MIELLVIVVMVAFTLAVGTDDGMNFVLTLLQGVHAKATTAVKRTFKTARMIVTALLVAYAVSLLGFTFGLLGHASGVVIGTGLALSAIGVIFFFVLSHFTPKTYIKLNGEKAVNPGPSMLATLLLLPLPIVLYAGMAPYHLYEWFLGAYGAFLLIGFGVVIIGKLKRSKVFYAPYAITGIMAVSGIIFGLIYAFPQEARAMVIERKISNRDSGRENLAKEIGLRVEDKVVEDIAYWWHYSENSDGTARITRFTDSNGKQCYSKKGDVFKTYKPSADSAEVGGTYIPIYFKDAKTGEYVFVDEEPQGSGCVAGIDEDRLPWIKASATTVGSSISTIQASSKPSRPTLSGPSFRLDATADVLNSGISVKKGDLVRISSDGTASAASSEKDGATKSVGPDGWGSDPTFNKGRQGPLPRGASFMALSVRVSDSKPSLSDGKWKQVGTYLEFRAEADGIVWFTINDPVVDERGVFHASWRQDNTGGFDITVETAAKPSSSTTV